MDFRFWRVDPEVLLIGDAVLIAVAMAIVFARAAKKKE